MGHKSIRHLTIIPPPIDTDLSLRLFLISADRLGRHSVPPTAGISANSSPRQRFFSFKLLKVCDDIFSSMLCVVLYSLPLDYIPTMQTSIKIHVIPAVLILTPTRAAENYNICFNLLTSLTSRLSLIKTQFSPVRILLVVPKLTTNLLTRLYLFNLNRPVLDL